MPGRTLASLFVPIEADDRPLNRAADRVRRTLTGLDRMRVQPRVTAPNVAAVGATFNRSMRRVGEDGGRSMSSGFHALAVGSIASAIGNVTATGVTALLGLGAAAVTSGVKTAAGMETARIGFTTMLGSAKQADQFLRQLANFAAKTPFEFPELQQSASQLVAVGINAKDVIPIMRTLGDITAGMGTGSEGIHRAVVAIQQMNAAQRISAEDLNQLRDAGIPVYELLAKATGKSAKEIANMAQKGKLGKRELDQLMQSLRSGQGLERFNGLMQKSSQSLTGLWSTLKDTFNLGMAKALGPVIPLLKTGLQGAITAVGQAMPPVIHGLTWFTNAATGLYNLLGRGDYTGRLRKAFGWFEDDRVVDIILRVRSGILGVVGAISRVAHGRGLSSFIGADVAPRVRGIIDAFSGLWRTLRPIFGQIGQAIASAFGGGRGTATVEAYKTYIVSALEFIQALVRRVTDAIRIIWDHWGKNILAIVHGSWSAVIIVIGDALKSIAGMLQFFTGILQGDWGKALDGLRKSGAAQMDGIKAIFAGVWNIIRNTAGAALSKLADIAGRAFDAVRARITQVWQGVVADLDRAWGSITSTASSAWQAVARAVLGVWDGVTGFLSRTWAGMAKAASTAWSAVSSAVQSALSFIGRVITAAIQPWVTLFKVAFTAITTAVLLAFGAIVKIVQQVWSPIWDHVIAPAWRRIQRGWDAASAAVRAAWNGLWSGVRQVASTAWHWVYDKLITPVWRSISAKFTAAHAAVNTAWTGFWRAVKTAASSAWHWVRDKLIGPVWTSISAKFTAAQTAVKTAWSGFWGAVKTTASTAWHWVRDKLIGPVWTSISSKFTGAQTGVKRGWSGFWDGVKATAKAAIDWVKTHIDTVLGKIKTAFSTAKTDIGKVWDGVKGKVSAPINWVKDHVYNSPLVPVWNRVAALVNGPRLKTYARGGIEPGYTPGRDTHLIGVSGGEAIMRPEWTRVAGSKYIHQANAAARSGGLRGARRFIRRNGLPNTDTGTAEGYAGGGIVGWFRNTIGHAAHTISGLANKLKGWVLGGLRTAAGKLLNPVKGLIRGAMPNSRLGDTIGALGGKAIDLILDKIKRSEDSAAVPGSAIVGNIDVNNPRGLVRVGNVGYWSNLFAAAIRRVEQSVGRHFHVFQAGWNPGRVAASGNTHDQDAIDARQDAGLLHGFTRMVGAMWMRNWPGNYHMHGVPAPNRGYGSPSARWQYQDFLRGGTGLADGALVRGGRGGVQALIGESRRDELVLPLPKGWDQPRQHQDADRLLRALERYRGPLVHVDRVESGVDLDLFARQASFRDRAGAFT
jgi:tape measure domain-containing protein